MPSKRKKKKNSSHPALALTLCLAAYLGVGWFLITSIYTTPAAKGIQLETGQNFQGTSYQNSLDLRIAKRASFPSEAITKAEDLGTANGTHRYVINFKVKADGLSEYGLMSLPNTGPPAGGYPVILLLHAYYFPETYQTEDGYLADMDYYASQGFAVIKPDFRGHGRSSLQGRPDGANYSMAYNTDVMSLISAVKLTGYLNPKAINLWGHSMGAHLALRASVLSGDVKSVILLAGPVSSYSRMFADYSAPSDIGNPVAAEIRAKALIKYGTPESNPGFWKYVSPINYITKNSSVYYQIHVGSDDLVVPPAFSADLDVKLNSLDKQHGYFVHYGGDHDLGGFRPQIWAESMKVLVKN